MQSLGYENIGRSPRRVFKEDLVRPSLWRVKGMAGTVDDYLAAQAPGYN